jgi:hypothetical protein
VNGSEKHSYRTNTRRYPRYDLDTGLKVTLTGAENRMAMRGRSLNIGRGGIAGLFVTGWDIGLSVNLEFSVPVTSEPLQVKAVIRNRSDCRYGFEFVNVGGASREIILKTCRTLAVLE